MTILEIIHDLRRMAPHFGDINDYINTAKEDCTARNAYRRIEEIYNHVMKELNKDLPKIDKGLKNREGGTL